MDVYKKTSSKYGKGYKDAKLFFMSSFQDFLDNQNDDKKCIQIIEEVRFKIVDYIGIFLTYDIDDIVSKMIKKNLNTQNVIHLLDYLDFIFNEDFYYIIDSVIKQKIINKIQLTNEDKFYYIGIITIEVLKIMIIKKLLNKYNIDSPKNPLENVIIQSYISCFEDRNFYSKKIIMKYYNYVKTNFNEWKEVLSLSKDIIIRNNILQNK